MSFFHYFSNDAGKRARFIFDLIAPWYGWIEKHQVENYMHTIDVLDREIGIKGKRVLDVGAGTGAWAGMFLQKQAEHVTAVDFSPKMVEEGRKKHPEIRFLTGDAENLEKVKDDTFDIVTASFVLHGVKADRRRKILSEMKRISREHVVVNDFNGATGWAVGILEAFERSDFKNFKTNFLSEMRTFFPNARILETVPGNALYVGKKSGQAPVLEEPD